MSSSYEPLQVCALQAKIITANAWVKSKPQVCAPAFKIESFLQQIHCLRIKLWLKLRKLKQIEPGQIGIFPHWL